MAKKKTKETELSSPTIGGMPSKDYDAENAFDTLMRAEEHKQDADLMKRVHKHAKKKKKAINSLAGLKAAAANRRRELQEGEGEDDTDDETLE